MSVIIITHLQKASPGEASPFFFLVYFVFQGRLYYTHLEHDFVILSVTQRQHPVCFHVQVLQQLLDSLALRSTSWQYLRQEF